MRQGLRRFFACVGSLAGNGSGNVLLMTAVGMPVIVGVAGLATDTVQWSLWKRQLQRGADTAAIAGAYAVVQGKSATSAATVALSKDVDLNPSPAATVENAPTTGAYAGNSKAVRVVLQASRRLPFSSLFMSSPPVVRAEATAAALNNGNYCVLALENTNAVGISMQGNATLNLGCGMATNSRRSNAVAPGGSSTIVATPITAVGGLSPSSNYVSPTTLEPYSVAQIDPYESLPTPTPSGCTAEEKVNPNQTRTITPGCYRGMDIKGTANLSPGIYYIDGGSFSVGSQGTVIGTGVTIILTSTTAATDPSSIATININGGANLQLTASTSGTYAGVLIYQDRRAVDTGSDNANLINGNATSILQGAIYLPKQGATFSGTAGMTTNCLQFVARRVTFTGNSTINNQCPPGSGASSFVGTRIRLVA